MIKETPARRTTISIDAVSARILAKYADAGSTATSTINRALKLLDVFESEIGQDFDVVTVPKGTQVPGGTAHHFI